jgi:hypothetical protein
MNAILKKNVLAILLFAAGALQAQEENKKENSIGLSGGFGHCSFTAQSLDLKAWNGLLAANGYGAISSNQLSLGGGGNFALKSFLIGGEGAGFVGSSTSSALNAIDFDGGYGFLNAGYVIPAGKKWLLYPMLGAGAGGYSILIRQKNPNSNFSDQISTPNGGTLMEAGGLLFNAQLGCQYFFCGKNTQGFFVGLKSGYRFSPTAWKLRVSGTEMAGAPEINMNGFYATLILGGGSVVKTN